MFISKKRWQALTKRIADLEGQVQSQQTLTLKTDSNGVVKIISDSFKQAQRQCDMH